MSDMREVFDDMRQHKRRRKEERDQMNHSMLHECPWPYEERENSVLFRVPGKPKADFYPSTNKWVIGGKVYHGNLLRFIKFYENAEVDK